MDKIKKEVNDCNKEVVKELSNLYNKLSDSLDKSYYYGQKSGYEEILAWFTQNKSQKFISPKKIKNYLIEKGTKSKLLLNNKSKNNTFNIEDIRKKHNKANFNYLYYNQTFNTDNNGNKNEQNVFPLSVERAFNNKANNPFNPILFNNNSNNGFNNLNNQNNNISLLSNPSMNINFSNNFNNNCFIRNNINSSNNNSMNDSQDEQMKQTSPLRMNFIQGNINLKRKKNS
jgi:hypothetical protein